LCTSSMDPMNAILTCLKKRSEDKLGKWASHHITNA
jgi:hypothetical protein